MDGFAEFSREVLKCLRQPLEDRDVVVSRAKAHSRYRYQFMLVATANPCRCEYIWQIQVALATVHHCVGRSILKATQVR